MADTNLPTPSERTATEQDALLSFAPGRLFFGVRNEDGLKALVDEKVRSLHDFQSLYFDKPLIGYPYRTVSLFLDGGGVYDFVPGAFVPDEQALSLWLPGLPEGARIIRERFADQGFELVSAVSEDLAEFVSRSFSRYTFSHPVTGLVQAALQSSRLSGARVLFGAVSRIGGEDVLDLVLASGGRVCFTNRFFLHGETDALYFVTSVWRAEDLDREEDAFRLFGDQITPGMSAALAPIKKAVKSFEINSFSELGRELPGAENFPALLRLKMLCA